MTDAPVHYLKTAKTTWSPPHLYVFDTETRTLNEGDDQVETLRLWCAKITDRHGKVIGDRSSRWTRGTNAQSLAASIDAASERRHTLWCFAHNLAFDMASTRLPLNLIALGWTVGDFALSGATPWMRLSNGRRSLTLVDSVSYLPASIDEIGKLLGERKPRLPAQDAPDAVWLRRCRADVSILSHALVELMDWHDTRGRGYWSLSGTATAWGHMRQRLADKAIVIDPAPEAQARDRAALYGGRRQCWRVGTFRARRYLEVDLVSAYPTIAAALKVPTRRVETFDSVPLDHAVWDDDGLGMLARARVRTDRPRYPLRLGEATWHPTGEFWTVLAGPELRQARDRGHLVEVGPGELHQVSDALAPWAQWLLGSRGLPDDMVSPVIKHSLKTWSRTVIGRFASHSWTRTELGPAPGNGWNYEPGINGATGLPGGMVDLAGRRWWTEQNAGSDNAYPAVTAWIESAIRDALATVIDAIGEGAIVCANTDGLIVAEAMLGGVAAGGSVRAPAGLTGQHRTRWVLDAVSSRVAPLRLAVKRSTTNLTVLGPAHVKFGAVRKLAGIPVDATEDTDGAYRFRAWPSLTWQMTEGDERGYRRPMMLRRIDGPYPAAWILDNGDVFPPHAVITAQGETRLLSWPRTPNRPPGRELGGAQHAYLDTLL